MNTTLFLNLRNNSKCSLKNVIKYYSSEVEHIQIPQRIQRGPTDILRALANTVKRDPTAPHYKFHDDPYLIPYSNLAKRSYALSLEAGRKAAQWVREEHSELFQHKVAEPFIEAFVPKPVYDENSEVNEDLLKKVIKNILVSDAITVYRLLENKGIEISRETQQSLLELLCFYNCEDTLNEDWIEERWFRSGQKTRDTPRKTWKETGLAWELFKKMKPADSKSYSAVISGMCTYGQVETAWKLYEESVSNKIPVSMSAYNAILSRVNSLRESHELIWQLTLDILSAMSENNLRPNLQTLNSVLEVLSTMHINRNTKSNALSIIAECKQFGVEPSLASYYHLLNIFCRERGVSSGILIDIMDNIEGKRFEATDPKDALFFNRAMEVCRGHLHSKSLAYRVYNFLNVEDNYRLIGDSLKESVFYRNFLILLIETEPLDDFMTVYYKLVPNIYVPEPSVMQEILSAVKLSGEIEHLQKLWSDIVLFDLQERQGLLNEVLDIAAQNMDETYFGSLESIGWSIWEKIEGQQRERNRIEWTGKMLSNLMMIFLHSGDKQKVILVFDKLQKEQNKILGEPDVLPLQLFVDACIQDANADLAIKCVQYCHEVGFLETDDLARKINSSLDLKEGQINRLIGIVGKETLEAKPKSS